ncbi:hypothetical protein AVEN_71182-1 [Araneus ventricosus]|uniref:Uncharacterized protein n=1 Tax=Araneus ventricosus TaxID=182803 RepID=A0A4Y2TLT8_ARAVE|nr:hypothetical protein AVEN_71182-1 [Araneus ventricosus]
MPDLYLYTSLIKETLDGIDMPDIIFLNKDIVPLGEEIQNDLSALMSVETSLVFTLCEIVSREPLYFGEDYQDSATQRRSNFLEFIEIAVGQIDIGFFD